MKNVIEMELKSNAAKLLLRDKIAELEKLEKEYEQYKAAHEHFFKAKTNEVAKLRNDIDILVAEQTAQTMWIATIIRKYCPDGKCKITDKEIKSYKNKCVLDAVHTGKQGNGTITIAVKRKMVQ